MKIRLTHEAWIAGKEYPAGTVLEMSEFNGEFLVRMHRAEEIVEEGIASAAECPRVLGYSRLAMTEDGGLALTEEKPKRKRSRKKVSDG